MSEVSRGQRDSKQKGDGAPFDGTGRGRAWPLLTGERGHYELSKGGDPTSCIKAMEGFASKGGMLPEQIWDEADLPEHGMYLGRQAGSAMPLMWAHAEYIKLLRSASGGDIYDCVRTVADRYRDGNGRHDLEVWKPKRQARRVHRGHTLRVQAPRPFRLRWTKSDWEKHKDVEAKDSGLGIWYADVKIPKSQKAPVRFTFFRLDTQTWEARNYRTDVDG